MYLIGHSAVIEFTRRPTIQWLQYNPTIHRNIFFSTLRNITVTIEISVLKIRPTQPYQVNSNLSIQNSKYYKQGR